MSPTPILDRQQLLPPPPREKRVLSYAIGAALGVALLFLPHSLVSDPDPLAPLLFLAGFLGGFFFGILFHEIGHLLAGLAVGFEFRRILAGPLMLTRESRGYRLRFLRGRMIAGGYTFMSPQAPVDLLRRFAIFALGGPLVTALLFVPIALLPWGTLSGSLLLANLILAGSSWLPFETKGHYTDAKIIQILWCGGPAADRLASVLYLMAIDGRGVHPKEWPPEVVAKLATDGGGRAYRAGGRIFLYIYARETARTPEAAAALEQTLALAAEMRADLRRAYFAEAAFWQGADNRNATVARAWLADARAIKRTVSLKDWDAGALAAIAFAEGKSEECRGHVDRALAFLDRSPGPSGSVAAARARLTKLMESQSQASHATAASTRPQDR